MNTNQLIRFICIVLTFLPATLLAAPEYVGEKACQSCHQAASEEWNGSHHQLAMQVANEGSVLADFGHTRFSKDGVESTFFIDHGRYMVNTDGPDGSLREEIVGGL